MFVFILTLTQNAMHKSIFEQERDPFKLNCLEIVQITNN